MRITAEAKAATRDRILLAATQLFESKGFEATTTRDIAQAAQIATGTLFNYFATKEAIVTQLVADALDGARDVTAPRIGGAETLVEALFALVAGELRRLRPFRKFIVPMLETVLSPLNATNRAGDPDPIRLGHLEAVTALVWRHQKTELSPVALQLYWTLVTGVLAHWASDKSPKQEDTLALLDHSLSMFVTWLGARPNGDR
jgi:AcrR family transcriptional regulator